MAKVTQETFDGVVTENMDEFCMSLGEAIEDTVKQFEAQGADLSNVVIDLMANAIDASVLKEAITKLDNLIKANKPTNELLHELQVIQRECEKGLNYRVIAGKSGIYKTLIQLINKEIQNKDNLITCLKTLKALMISQPDLLGDAGIKTMITVLDKQKDNLVVIALLEWTKECCVLHEQNRQLIMDSGILDHLKPLLGNASADLICATLSVLRALVLDDDIRVEFGKSHEHARIIASDTLCAITNLFAKFKTNQTLINELLLTLSALLVRTEFCKKVEDAGGIGIIKDAMKEFQDNDKIVRNSFKVLKALAGNDECKRHIVKQGLAPLIVSSLNRHKTLAPTCVLGLGCISALTLRSPENSEALYSAEAPKAIIAVMKQHPDNEMIQKTGSWAIRNMVSRSRHQSKTFLDLGAEDLLRKTMKKYRKIEYDLKAALRDLGCNVEFKEEWTGKGGKLTSDEKKTHA